MSDIPSDIQETASAVYVDACRHTNQAEIIARAILAERERCAQIAEANNHFPNEGAYIASIIRTPSQTGVQ